MCFGHIHPSPPLPAPPLSLPIQLCLFSKPIKSNLWCSLGCVAIYCLLAQCLAANTSSDGNRTSWPPPHFHARIWTDLNFPGSCARWHEFPTVWRMPGWLWRGGGGGRGRGGAWLHIQHCLPWILRALLRRQAVSSLCSHRFSLPCLPALFIKKNLPAQHLEHPWPLTLDPALSLEAVQGFIFCLGFKTGLDQMR